MRRDSGGLGCGRDLQRRSDPVDLKVMSSSMEEERAVVRLWEQRAVVEDMSTAVVQSPELRVSRGAIDGREVAVPSHRRTCAATLAERANL